MPKLNKLELKDKNLFNRFLSLRPHELSVYGFENIYIWKALFDIRWKIIKENLCIFFQNGTGCFLYCSPLGKALDAETIEQAFQIMGQNNSSLEVSRIENVEEKDLLFYRDLGYTYAPKFSDYLCKRTDLVRLKGNRFKSKRASYNYFIKNYKFAYLPYSAEYKKNCLDLYDYWCSQRTSAYPDLMYRLMQTDSRSCLKILLDNYASLGFQGRVVKIDGNIEAFTFGFPLHKDIFCILFEITDLSIKGLSQFIFRQFTSELKDYPYINIMDDSGLENLEKTKLSYCPVRLVKNYIVKIEEGRP